MEKSISKWLKVDDSDVDKFDIDGGKKLAKKSGKSKGQKLFKS